MEPFIVSVREKTRVAAFEVDVAASSVEKVLKFWQMMYEDEAGWPGTPIIEGETSFQLVRRIVEDTDNLESAIRTATQGTDVPRQPGFITSRRRASRARNNFMRSLEDDD